ncbi:hypothetical protein KEJ34_06510 [Candidatus Bathyarchaeota archaeon]|nr:hypothetical protein [Candidatus Bathyarchaeota archaeon]
MNWGYTHITQFIYVPKFNKNNPLHCRLSRLYERAHELDRQIYEAKRGDLKKDLQQIEEEIKLKQTMSYGERIRASYQRLIRLETLVFLLVEVKRKKLKLLENKKGDLREKPPSFEEK